MNGGQDLGGMMGFGPVVDEENEPIFHARWEARVLAMTLAMGALGLWNIDKGRHARENRPPSQYLNWSYYQIWLAGLEELMNANNLLGETDTARSHNLTPLAPENVAVTLAKGGPADRPANTPPRYGPGDTITTNIENPHCHTRLPRYLRGKKGTIIAVHGCHVFPDDAAHDRGENPQWLYGVRFNARDLWGSTANPNDHVHADLWEPYFV